MAEEMKDLSELKKSAVPVTEDKGSIKEITDGKSDGLIISDDAPTPEVETEEEKESRDAEYEGKGFISDAKAVPHTKESPIAIGPMANKDTVHNVQETLRDMDEQINEQHKKFLEMTKGGKVLPKTDEEGNPTTDASVEILIDKVGLATIEFTDEEKKKLEYSKRIKLVEVTDEKLKSIKIKKVIANKDDFAVVKKTFDKTLTPVIAMASGYSTKLKNVSTVEAIRMYQRPGNDSANSLLEKWSVIYDKLVDVSCGAFENFEDFLKRTAFIDYECFLYGIICGSYPEKDSVEFMCNQKNCNNSWSIDYTNRDMLRADLITDKQKENISRIINASGNIAAAKEVAENALVNNNKRFVIPDDSGIIVEIYVPSAWEMIENVFRKLDADEKLSTEDNRNSVIIGQSVSTIYKPDFSTIQKEGDDPEYYKIEGLESIVETLNSMTEFQMKTIANRISDFTRDYTFSFSLKEVKCPACHHNYHQYNFDLDQILFQRVQRRLQTEVE